MQREYERGDVVRLRVTPQIAGQVVGEMDWGRRYLVRLHGSIDEEWFDVVELEFYPVPPAAAAAAAVPEKGVVIDFTKAKELRANTKTRGAA